MLEVTNLQVAYNHQIVLDNLNLCLHKGEILALVGPNGAGKSTLVRAICGLVSVRHGAIRVNTQEITRWPASRRARLIALVPQERSLPASFTVWQTVLLGRTPYIGWLGRLNAEDIEKAREAMRLTMIEALKDRQLSDLSGGEIQRVILARALAQDTPLLLLDEPTTFLDLKHQSSLLQLLCRLVVERQLAVLMVMHDLNAASTYAHRVAILHRGTLVACGHASQVFHPKLLSEVYETEVHVFTHPNYGVPVIFPDGHRLTQRNSASPAGSFAGIIGDHSKTAGLCFEPHTTNPLSDST